MDIITAGTFETEFTGAPDVSARHNFDTPVDISQVNNVKLTIETTNAHADIYVRFESDENNYIELKMGGDKTGADETETRTQDLSVDLREMVHNIESGKTELDTRQINSVSIHFADDGNVNGIASANKESIALSYDESIESTIQYTEGFITYLQNNIELTDSTLVMKGRPADPRTGEVLTECLFIVSDDVIVPVYNLENPASQIGETRGETIWATHNPDTQYDSELETSTWTILQRGGQDVQIMPTFSSFRPSHRISEHIKESGKITIVIQRGAIEAGVDEAKREVENIQEQQDEFETEIQTQQTEFQEAETAAREEDQEAFEQQMNSDYQNFTANQREITIKINESDATKIDISAGNWIDAETTRSFAGVVGEAPAVGGNYYQLESGTGNLISNQSEFESGNFPIAFVMVESDGSITSTTNYGASYLIAAPSEVFDMAECTNLVYDEDGNLTQFEDADSIVWTLTYDSDGYIETISDGTETTTINRDTDGNFTGVSYS